MPVDMSEPEARPRPRRRPRAKSDAPLASITLRHPDKEATKRIALGFAWDVFLLSGVTFGLPLFLRRLPQWGAAFLALWLINLLVSRFAPHLLWLAEVPLFAAFLGLQLWLGVKGNALTARAYVARGWTVEHARDPAVERVLARWRVER
jgi:hypothetical protein